ncbi:MAG: type IIA DNA topoisomerase subunit B [Actinobacteria bacterium]|nr:type IIA DNA topoisomerase subunit B [Actinomycetota bacterium]NBY15041.1 type IIA DNA topoisomerase subunit B [Actinomycetota bacterium]
MAASSSAKTPKKATQSADYSAASLLVLEGLDAVRKRPGMYIGSTDSRGLQHCLWEIIDNSVDEALGGHCNRIEIVLHSDTSATVVDNGRGIPVDIESKTKLSGVEVVMTKLHAGGKFGGTSYTASGGLHGVGASVVNALSARLDVEVDRDGTTYGMSFRRGVPGNFAGNEETSTFTKQSGLKKIGKAAKKTATGTRITFWADMQIFTAGAGFDIADIHARARQTSFLVPGLLLVVTDERSGKAQTEEFLHAGGISEFCEFLSQGNSLGPVIRLNGQGDFKETVPVLDDNGHMTAQELDRTLGVDVALLWNDGYDNAMQSFVNIIATPKGGTHVAGFERALVKVINEQLKAVRLLKSADEPVTKEDVQEGMTAVVTVRVAEPQFEGQTKEVLGTPAATKIVNSVISKELTSWFTNPPRGAKPATKLILEKILNASRTRIAARTHRDTQRRKTALEASTLPAKLKDCRSEDPNLTELFIVEGDSALGTAKSARNSEFQALLPIRGKILNVQKASLADMLKNSECASIIQVIGGGSGPSFDLAAARYGKIIILADADVDGAHIRTLLLTLFHRYLNPLLESGRVFAAVPPLHRIEVIGGGKKASEVIYTYSDEQMRQTTADLTKQGRKWKEPIQRYKGLGEMDASQLRETTMDPTKRTLRRITMADVASAKSVFELLMGNEVAPRKEFIVDGASALDRTRIDA